MPDPGGGGPVGVLVMAYGTPATPADVEGYYTHVRRGRPPPPELLDDLRRRYQAIGGTSPLAARTRGQVDALRRELGPRFAVALGQKHAPPFVEDGVGELRAAGASRLVGLVLAPHYSALSVGQYHERAEAAARPAAYTGVRSWHLRPALVDLLAGRVAEARARLGPGRVVETVFTAHSLPERARTLDRPTYPDQLLATARAVAARAGLERWRVAWQSAGRTADPWIGPDLREVMPVLAAEGTEAVVVCPAGFVSDHLEVLYDVDVEARAAAAAAGMDLVRTASLNDDPAFVALLAAVVRDHAAGAPSAG